MNRTTVSQWIGCAIGTLQSSMKTSSWLDLALASHRGRVANSGCLMELCDARGGPLSILAYYTAENFGLHTIICDD
jgi:hypothetical protein